ncbi:hypothetical protein DUI87_32543 [Hirundo rustica rustica]|uniref:Uncharacterized protein n=1 Tax=Hirundo rustica rustica TaxID=333673 RepID=A0A3M0IQG9_HIRRU|nr:hypothetical protein DUI87_32543 [Hirundo rustica rustica]
MGTGGTRIGTGRPGWVPGGPDRYRIDQDGNRGYQDRYRIDQGGYRGDQDRYRIDQVGTRGGTRIGTGIDQDRYGGDQDRYRIDPDGTGVPGSVPDRPGGRTLSLPWEDPRERAAAKG